jgi:hypothetical protein
MIAPQESEDLMKPRFPPSVWLLLVALVLMTACSSTPTPAAPATSVPNAPGPAAPVSASPKVIPSTTPTNVPIQQLDQTATLSVGGSITLENKNTHDKISIKNDGNTSGIVTTNSQVQVTLTWFGNTQTRWYDVDTPYRTQMNGVRIKPHIEGQVTLTVLYSHDWGISE